MLLRDSQGGPPNYFILNLEGRSKPLVSLVFQNVKSELLRFQFNFNKILLRLYQDLLGFKASDGFLGRPTELLHIKFKRKEQTLSFALVLKLKSELLRFWFDFLKILLGLYQCFKASEGFLWRPAKLLFIKFTRKEQTLSFASVSKGEV